MRKVKEGNSLAEWMIKNLGEDSIEKYWSNKNEFTPWDVSYGSHKEVWMSCKEEYCHDDYLIIVKKFTIGGIRCPCNRWARKVDREDSFAQWCIDNIDENFIEKYWSEKNTVNPFKIAKLSNKEIYIKCQNKDYHNDYKITPNLFIGQGIRCPYCATNGSTKVHPLDSLGEFHSEVLFLWSDKNERTPFEYTPKSNQLVYWKCENGTHEDYKRRIKQSNNCNFRCPKCVVEKESSLLQEKVSLFFNNELNYNVKHEFDTNIKCFNPKTNHRLPYDNEISIDSNNHLIIEVNGKQHYQICSWHTLTAKRNGTTPQEELKYLQWKDQYKMDYAVSQGYHYLIIPYWTDNEQEDWKVLIINKLNEINTYKLRKN